MQNKDDKTLFVDFDDIEDLVLNNEEYMDLLGSASIDRKYNKQYNCIDITVKSEFSKIEIHISLKDLKKYYRFKNCKYTKMYINTYPDTDNYEEGFLLFD